MFFKDIKGYTYQKKVVQKVIKIIYTRIYMYRSSRKGEGEISAICMYSIYISISDIAHRVLYLSDAL